MFGGLFGEKRKIALIRELLEIRMVAAGFGSLEYRLQIKEMSNFKLLGMPECTLVSILEAVVKNQRRGALLFEILQAIETARKSTGSDYKRFNEILQEAAHGNGDVAVFAYCAYRMEVEHYGVVTEDQLLESFALCSHEIMSWRL